MLTLVSELMNWFFTIAMRYFGRTASLKHPV